VGDYHFAALTSDGALLTWGNYSLGALGLGDPRKLEIGAPGGYPELRLRNASQTHRNIPPPVGVPSRVRFDHVVEVGERRKAKFCFATTAGGWHTGALCIDLEEDGEEGVGDSLTHGGPDAGSNMPGAFPDLPSQQTDEREERGGFPRPGHGLAGGFFPFRVGHADRGRLRGANPGGIIGQGRGGAGMTERHGEES
jgi:SCF-associated factor 1